jgi:glycosyltransferase involved in cell wall biosynthesis
LSVLVASHERRARLRRCLEALAAQTAAPESFEVIVADDGSTDGSAEMAAGLETPFVLRVLKLPHGGKYRAVNAALEQAHGRVCLVLDDDIVAGPRLIEAHAAAHRSNGAILGIGVLTQEPPPGRDWYATASARGWNEHFSELSSRAAEWTDCYGANFSAPHSSLVEIGGFATELSIAGDLEIGLRLQEAGCVPTYLPEAVGAHEDYKSSRKMLDNARRQGAAHVELARRHPEAASEFLDWTDAGSRELWLRSLLIRLRVPPPPIHLLGHLIPGEGRKMVWFHFLHRFAFWRSVRRHVSREQWARLTGGG